MRQEASKQKVELDPATAAAYDSIDKYEMFTRGEGEEPTIADDINLARVVCRKCGAVFRFRPKILADREKLWSEARTLGQAVIAADERGDAEALEKACAKWRKYLTENGVRYHDT